MVCLCKPHSLLGQADMQAFAWLCLSKVTKTALRSNPDPLSRLLASCMKLPIFFSIFLILCCRAAAGAQRRAGHGSAHAHASTQDTYFASV